MIARIPGSENAARRVGAGHIDDLLALCPADSSASCNAVPASIQLLAMLLNLEVSRKRHRQIRDLRRWDHGNRGFPLPLRQALGSPGAFQAGPSLRTRLSGLRSDGGLKMTASPGRRPSSGSWMAPPSTWHSAGMSGSDDGRKQRTRGTSTALASATGSRYRGENGPARPAL